MSVTLYARADVAETKTSSGTVHKTTKKGDQLVVLVPETDVDELLATGAYARSQRDVPLTPDQIDAAERLERDGNIAMQTAARAIAAQATDTVAEKKTRARRRG